MTGQTVSRRSRILGWLVTILLFLCLGGQALWWWYDHGFDLYVGIFALIAITIAGVAFVRRRQSSS